jgi:hypothetical protein
MRDMLPRAPPFRALPNPDVGSDGADPDEPQGVQMKTTNLKHVIGYSVVVLLAITGTAQALPGKNTVDSGDIKNGQVKAPDLAPGSVSAAKLAENAVTGASVADESLGQADVNESDLNFASAGCRLGLVHSFVSIPADLAINAAFVTRPGHNCSDAQILVAHPSAGQYLIIFDGDPATLGIAQSTESDVSIGVLKNGAPFEVEQRTHTGTLVNSSFSLFTY